MLLLIPQGTSGLIPIGTGETVSISLDEGSLGGSISVDTLDAMRLMLNDSAVQRPRVDPTDFIGISIAEAAILSISGTTSKPTTDTASLTLIETIGANANAVALTVLDDASLTLSDVSSIDINQIGIDTNDDVSLSLDDHAISSGVADVARLSGDGASLHLEDAGSVYVFLPVAFIRFEPQPDSIVFSVGILQ